jgi:hypothetical protein
MRLWSYNHVLALLLLSVFICLTNKCIRSSPFFSLINSSSLSLLLSSQVNSCLCILMLFCIQLVEATGSALLSPPHLSLLFHGRSFVPDMSPSSFIPWFLLLFQIFSRCVLFFSRDIYDHIAACTVSLANRPPISALEPHSLTLRFSVLLAYLFHFFVPLHLSAFFWFPSVEDIQPQLHFDLVRFWISRLRIILLRNLYSFV